MSTLLLPLIEADTHFTSFPLSAVCSGGLTGFALDDGSQRLLDMAQAMEETFVTYDMSGNPISPAHRFLTDCPISFVKPDCLGSCNNCRDTKSKASCLGRKLKCKGSSIEGLSFPFMSDPIKVIGLFSGGDIE